MNATIKQILTEAKQKCVNCEQPAVMTFVIGGYPVCYEHRFKKLNPKKEEVNG